jgi:GNAT superfamily N-acetyltransferase
MLIRPLVHSEISQLHGFSPPDWNSDISIVMETHFHQSYFFPVAAEREGVIVGCGHGILNGNVGWLGNIFVLPEHRNKGIGKAITQYLVDFFHSKNCKSQLLVATVLGEPVYRKLGFQKSSSYIFFKRETSVVFDSQPNVRSIQDSQIPVIQKLDRVISGEDRFPLIKRFLSTARIVENQESDEIEGIYLPDYGQGLILARTEEAGISLMKVRLSQGKTNAVVPEANSAARQFLIEQGFHEHQTAPRMFLGKDVTWKETMVFNRGTGYCG